jgi:hypothetical protein
VTNTCSRQSPLSTHVRRHASPPDPASLKLHVSHRWSRAGKTKSVFFAFTSVNDRRNTYPATMLGRNKNAQNEEIFEMGATLEENDTRPGHGRASNTTNLDKKTGNEQDKNDMERLGHPQELRVSSHTRHRLFAIF